MKDIDEIRRENLRRLEGEAGGPAEAARLVGMSPSQFTNLRDGAKDSKTGKRRGMRKETARRIEQAAGKPVGWLDANHADPTEEGRAPPPPWEAYLAASPITRAAVDLLLLPEARRSAVLAGCPQALTAVQLLEQHAHIVLTVRKSA